MNRNQKIALGCGGAGCLGIVLVVILAVVLGALGYMSIPGVSSNRNYNYNYNANSNRNSNYNSNDNRNTNTNSSDSSTLSDDDKHKLFQAAGMTKDNELIQRVLRKLGFLTSTGVSDDYQAFVKAHFAWAMKNIEFVQSVNNPTTARAYVDAHIND
jgi:hypothetical protein